ncbi:MAG: hypothetical protein IAE83_15085 [Anaerolinea sp.]|nr:hypothetical protein [Anaerolinea sp.]MCC6974494.1 hypothetical protein [Anaerolineae bacterium]CAG0997855.1 Intracellular exo-alpha-(1->5)-L-arabinofuranosidase [Anaerolineae bacterium]
MKHSQRRLLAGITLVVWLALMLSVAVGVSAAPVVLKVQADQALGPISPRLFGANYGPWAIMPPDVVPLAEKSGVKFLRYPGGEWGDQNDLTPFQLDTLYMAFANRINAEASLHVRLHNSTPEKAAELVRYMNVEKKYGLRYWAIGNEPDLFKEYSLEKYLKDWRAFAEAMKAVDPSILLIGPEISQYPPSDNAGTYLETRREWLKAFLKANGDLVDLITIHRYPFPKDSSSRKITKEEVAASALEWDYIIPNIRQISKEILGRELPIGVTEINTTWTADMGGETSNGSHYNAVWWAASLGTMIRQQADMVTFFNFYSNPPVGGFGLLARYDARPVYYVYVLYQQFGTQLLASQSDDVQVNITAALNDAGDLTLMIVNLSSEEKTVSLDIAGGNFASTAALTRLDLEHKADALGEIDLSSGEITLTPESVSLYVIKAKVG